MGLSTETSNSAAEGLDTNSALRNFARIIKHEEKRTRRSRQKKAYCRRSAISSDTVASLHCAMVWAASRMVAGSLRPHYERTLGVPAYLLFFFFFPDAPAEVAVTSTYGRWTRKACASAPTVNEDSSEMGSVTSVRRRPTRKGPSSLASAAYGAHPT